MDFVYNLLWPVTFVLAVMIVVTGIVAAIDPADNNTVRAQDDNARLWSVLDLHTQSLENENARSKSLLNRIEQLELESNRARDIDEALLQYVKTLLDAHVEPAPTQPEGVPEEVEP